MKRKLLFSIAVCVFVLTTGADAAVSGDYEYTDNLDGTCTITNYNSPGGDITIPDTLNGLTVIGLSPYAFWDCDDLTSITIGDSVTAIYGQGQVFNGCSSLQAIWVDEANPNFCSIDGVLFNKAQTYLIKHPEAKTGCYIIPDGVTTLDYHAFYQCLGLTCVIIPDSMTLIYSGSFYDCTGLSGLYFKGDAPEIGQGGTLNNVNATVYYLQGTTGWGSTFGGLPTAPWDDQYTWTDNGDTTCTITGYTGPGGDVVIPDTLDGLTVTDIGTSSFRENINLTGIVIPDSVTSIENYAFLHCSSLTGITLGNSVVTIEGYAFSGCIGQSGFIIPDSVISIGDRAFNDCIGLTDVTIGNGVANIEFLAFSGCTSLLTIAVDVLNPAYSSLDGVLFNKSQTELILFPAAQAGHYTIPNSVTRIKDYAFSDSSALTSIFIPSSVTTVESYAFYKCTSPMDIMVDSLNPAYSSFDSVLFDKEQNTLLKVPVGKSGSYVIPNTVIIIESYAFNECIDLTDVTIGNNVSSIGFGAFSGCAGLASIIIPDNVTSIRSYAFRDCIGLIGIIIPDSIARIESGAFFNCTSLTNIIIGSGVTSIQTSAFSGCSQFSEIFVDLANSTYSSLDGVLFNKDQTELILYPQAKTGSYVVPDGVTLIDTGAFGNCSELIDITIPASVTTIWYNAFGGCTGLQEINVSTSNLTYSSIDGVLFDKAQMELIWFPSAKSESYIIPDGVNNIRPSAFRDSTTLTCVIVPNSVTTIWSDAFYSCPALTGIYFRGNAPVESGEGHGFRDIPNAIVYYIPGTAGWEETFGGLPTTEWPLSIADVDVNGYVNLADFTVFAAAWRAASSEQAYNPLCDISEPVGVIDAADLEVFANEWLVTPCQ